MKYPEFLPDQGTIGFVAPSFGCSIEPYKTAFFHAQEKWKQLGFSVDAGPNCYAGEGIGISNTPAKCGQELTDYYLKQENQCLISCGGGELMCEILDFVDWDAIRKAKPKWYMGYSDNTNFTFLLATLCDVASIYGPCAAAFGMEPWHQALADAFALIQGKKLSFEGYERWEREGLKSAEQPLLPYHCTEKRISPVFAPEKDGELERTGEIEMKGRLLGGCMDCLVNLLGTKFDRVRAFAEAYQEDGIIWFLEACDLNVFAIRRAMWQMAHAGWFAHVKGFMIGRPVCCGQEMMGLNHYDAVLEVAKEYGVPVIMDMDIGHLPPAMPLITGAYAAVRAKENHITVSMELK